MTDSTHVARPAGHPKIGPAHLGRAAVVYVRQSTPGQTERNLESTDRQYALVDRAVELGWSRRAVEVIDEDLGVSGSAGTARSGFARLTADVALGRVGIVFGLEVSRLARSNADWYRLLDLAGITDTLIADADGIYHPASFNDRLVLGLKGTMSEAELHVLRARLEGGIRNKAARGELRRGLPVGLVWGEDDGEILLHPDEAVRGVIAAIFERFSELGSVRAVWLWLRSEELKIPVLRHGDVEPVWIEPTYAAVHRVLTHPSYAGAYVYGRTRRARRVDDDGRVRQRARHLPRAEWQVLIVDHHPGYIDWATFEANQARIATNTRPRAHEPGTGAVREGIALLQGLATCGRCGRRLAVHYQGANSTPGYYCANRTVVNGRGERCLSVGGAQIDQAVTAAFLAAVEPAGVHAAIAAAEAIEADHDAALAQWHRQVERARYEAARAERRYLAVDPDNRLVARGLEADWETSSPPSPTPKPNSPGAKPPAPAPSPTTSVAPSPRSVPTSGKCGRRRRPPTETAKSCCAPCSKKSASTSTARTAAPSSRCAGGAAPSPNWSSNCAAPTSPSTAPTKTPSHCCAGSPSTTPTPPSPAS
jgi:DNA invertase Pin-like site-specific DNA recombinase